MKSLILVAALFTAPPVFSQKTIQVPVSEITDKIRGGLLGQMLGNLNGIPHEFKYAAAPGSVEGYVPALPNGAWTDDDTDFEWVYILEMQRRRTVLLPYDTITALWTSRINKNIWCANRFARHLMDMGFAPPQTGDPQLNPWATFNVSGQFLCETFALLAPAMPQTAARTGLHYTRVAIGGEPAQTTQLFTAMIATAFVEKDIAAIFAAGAAAIDPGSKTFRLMEDARQWHRQLPDNWRLARAQLRDKYTQENGGMRDRNGTELNTGAILLALLYGNGDFAATLQLAFNLGWDADCNAATVGTILGAMHGYRAMLANGWKIVDRYTNTSRDQMPLDETITSFADRLVELFELVNTQQGGKRLLAGAVPVYAIRAQTPAPVVFVQGPEKPPTSLARLSKSLTSGDAPQRARAAYTAICLGQDSLLRQRHPEAWAAATRQLQGYWKVMQNIYAGGFIGLDAFAQRFTRAGIAPPAVKKTDAELYGDPVFWKPL